MQRHDTFQPTSSIYVVPGSLSADAASSPSTIQFSRGPLTFPRDAEIYSENDSAQYIYKVQRGAVRTLKMLDDGRRHIAGFYFPGDVFGLEAGPEHAFSAEAITDCDVIAVKRSVVVNLVASDRQATGELWGITSGELRRVQDHLTLLIKTARERVVGFLLEMSKRMGGASSLDLPMGRQDIADYLGLTIETVSRTLAELAQGGTIALPASRRIVVRDLAALEASRT